MRLNQGLVLFLGLAVSQAAPAADFSGRWVGTGHMGGWATNSDCSKIEVVMEQSAGKLVTRRYHAICGAMDSDWGPDTMEIRGSKVFDQGDEIGTLNGDTLVTSQNESGVAYQFNLELATGSDGKPLLRSEYGVTNYVGTITVKGDLHRE